MTEPIIAPEGTAAPAEGIAAPEGTAAPTNEFINFVPDTYKEKEWAKQNTKDPETFFKWVDNLETTVGKKGVIVPSEGAPQAEWEKYYADLGRPEKAEDYTFSPIPEYKDAEINTEVQQNMKNLLFEAGVPKDMATKLQQGYDKMMYSEQQRLAEENKKLNEAFDQQTSQLFGENKDAILANSKKLISENVSPEIQSKLETLDNDSLLVLASALDGIVKKYVKEDGFSGGEPNVSGSETYEQLSAQQRELMKDPAFTNFQHPDHEAIMKKNSELMAKMRNISK